MNVYTYYKFFVAEEQLPGDSDEWQCVAYAMDGDAVDEGFAELCGKGDTPFAAIISLCEKLDALEHS